MPQILPMKELRKTNKISDLCHAKREPIFITKNGYGDLVVMSMETYEDIISTGKPEGMAADDENEPAEAEKQGAEAEENSKGQLIKIMPRKSKNSDI